MARLVLRDINLRKRQERVGVGGSGSDVACVSNGGGRSGDWFSHVALDEAGGQRGERERKTLLRSRRGHWQPE